MITDKGPRGPQRGIISEEDTCDVCKREREREREREGGTGGIMVSSQ